MHDMGVRSVGLTTLENVEKKPRSTGPERCRLTTPAWEMPRLVGQMELRADCDGPASPRLGPRAPGLRIALTRAPAAEAANWASDLNCAPPATVSVFSK